MTVYHIILLRTDKFRWWITRKFTMQLALTILIVLVLYISWGYNQVNRGSSNGPHNERIFNDHDVVSPPVLTSKVNRRISLTNPEAALAMELETLCHQLHYTSLPPPLGLMVTENGYYNTSLLNAMDKQIHKLSLVHTLPPVLSPSECRWIIDTTEKYTKVIYLLAHVLNVHYMPIVFHVTAAVNIHRWNGLTVTRIPGKISTMTADKRCSSK